MMNKKPKMLRKKINRFKKDKVKKDLKRISMKVHQMAQIMTKMILEQIRMANFHMSMRKKIPYKSSSKRMRLVQQKTFSSKINSKVCFK